MTKLKKVEDDKFAKFYSEIKKLLDEFQIQQGKNMNAFYLDFDGQIKKIEERLLLVEKQSKLIPEPPKQKRIQGWNYTGTFHEVFPLTAQEINKAMSAIKELMEEWGLDVINGKLFKQVLNFPPADNIEPKV